MLIEFRVGNFRSIKNELTLSMVASTDPTHPDHLINSESMGEDSLLVSSVVYGANAAGKTNILLALNLMRNLVINSHVHQRGIELPFEPFGFDGESGGHPTQLEVVFLQGSMKYVYGFSYDRNKILEEHLYQYPKKKKGLLFERAHASPMKFPRADKETSDQREMIEKTTGENVLFLSMAAKMNYSPVFPVFDWFLKSLMTVGPADGIPFIANTMNMMKRDPESKSSILKALNVADLGILDIIEEDERPPEMGPAPLPPPRPGESQIVFQVTFGGPRITFVHRPYADEKNGQGVRLPLISESEGTKKMLGIIGPWIEALRTGGTLVVDELDTKLHHLIVRYLIGLFHDPEQNRKGAQLIFTTHDVNLLDQDLFRRDQVWLVERDADTGATLASSLAEFRIRKDLDIEKAYLSGRFGAIPNIMEEKVV
ncbi:MAG: ATP/GTP-binding protein [Methanomassiliicoccales archaeon]